MRKYRRYIAACCLITLATASATSLPSEKKLNALDQQISALQKTLQKNQDRSQQLENELKTAELTLGQLHQGLDNVNDHIEQQTRSLQQLTIKQHQFQTALTQQQDLLAKQVVNTYVLGQEAYLKMILNQEDPQVMGRNLIYYRYFNQARSQLITHFSHMVTQLNQTQARIAQKTRQLKNLASQKQQKISELDARSKNRDEILQSLQQSIEDNSQKLATLTQNKQALVNLIQQLQTEETSYPVTPPPLPFTSLQGQIPWPTKGIITQRYGAAIENSNLTYTGVLIAADEGQAVRTIYPGKVVFSGWLKGYGLLLIVDHGNGYMSLYGHNQSLYRKVGETVNAGDLLAKVGNSGGFNQSGLYFEIRYNGSPLDPQSWCTNNTKSQWLA